MEVRKKDDTILLIKLILDRKIVKIIGAYAV